MTKRYETSKEDVDVVNSASSEQTVEDISTKRLVVISVAVNLDKIQQSENVGTPTNEALDELTRLLGSDEFCSNTFGDMVKSRSDCRRITEDIVKKCMNR